MKPLKIILFVFLIVLLWMPIFQELTKYFKEPELTGAFVQPKKPECAVLSIKSLEFQKKWEEYENANFGFRGFFVKIRNSIDNILFSDLSVADNTAGKNEFIFSLGSINRTLGIDYNGKQKIDSTIEKIKFFKEGIERHGGHLLVVVAPSKEKALPDFLPYRYKGKYKTPNDYTDFIAGYKKEGIPFIDFCPYLKKLRDAGNFPVFTKTGFHWSMYAASFVQDSLVSYIEKSLGKSIPKYKRNGIELSDKSRGSDNDFENSLNLFFSVGQSQYTYPKFEMVTTTKKKYRPKVIVIGDSFFWQIKNQEVLKYVFSDDSKFWFYFATTSYSFGDTPSAPLIKNENLIKELESADYVILFSNLSTLATFPYGVTDFYMNGGIGNVEITKSIEAIIKSTAKDMDSLRAQVKLNNVSIEQLITAATKSIINGTKAIQLKAANGKYLCAGEEQDEIILANRDSSSSWETFYLLSLNGNRIALYSYKEKFLSSELNHQTEITANRPSIGNWEIFTLVKLPDSTVAFKAANGKYLSLNEKSLGIFANGNTIGRNEKFEITAVKNK